MSSWDIATAALLGIGEACALYWIFRSVYAVIQALRGKRTLIGDGFWRTTIRLATGRIAFERKARLLSAELGQRSAEMKRAHGYTGCDALEEAELVYHLLLTGECVR